MWFIMSRERLMCPCILVRHVFISYIYLIFLAFGTIFLLELQKIFLFLKGKSCLSLWAYEILICTSMLTCNACPLCLGLGIFIWISC